MHQVVLAGLQPQNRTTLTYVVGITAAEQDDPDIRWACGHSVVQLGLEHHDPGPVTAKPGQGDGRPAYRTPHTAAAGGGGSAGTRITDVSHT